MRENAFGFSAHMFQSDNFSYHSEAAGRQDRWLSQFVTAFGTDEGDSSTTFNGTIPQILMLSVNPEERQQSMEMVAVITGPAVGVLLLVELVLIVVL